jgi:hypothetical protein
MSEPNAPSTATGSLSEELSALLQERERYEQWLRQLDERRGTTPQTVYDRVHGDYSTRLRQVLQRIAGRTGELRSQIEALEARLTIIEREHSELRDERAEAELRHQVGEYSPEQWAEISAHTDEAISRAREQRQEVSGEIAQLREILMAATGTDAGAGERPSSAVVTDDSPQPESAAEPGEAAASHAAASPTQTAPALESREADPVTESAAPEMQASQPREESQRDVQREADRPSAAQPAVSDREAPPVPPVAEPSSPPSPARRGSGFDDLAFVSSLITPEQRKTPAAPTPAISLDHPPVDTPGRTERVTGRPSGPETPASFMKNVRGEAIKTLKCQECGTLNYPTEWYCERCGGELAAL